MTPFFNPGPNPYGHPRVFLAGVGERMTEVAGEVADGFICHGFSTERYVREVTLPALERGRQTAGKEMDGFELYGPMFVVTGRDEAQMAEAAKGVRRQIAFYGSTPAYRKVLDLHGWGDLQDELNRMSKEGRWAEMGDLIDDDILGEFAVVAPVDEVASSLAARWGGLLQRISFYAPYDLDDAGWAEVTATLRAA
jgi:probable F420-dependent oxidoreductase